MANLVLMRLIYRLSHTVNDSAETSQEYAQLCRIFDVIW